MNYYELTRGEKEIGYIDEGVGDTIILLHGFCGSHEYFKYLVPILAEKHRVVALDLRGHGGSSTSDEPYSVEDMADDVRDVMNDLKIDHASLFGHSLGGYAVLAFAEKYPEMTASFGLLHSTPFPDSEEGKAKRQHNIEQIEKEGIHSFINDLIPKLFAKENLDILGEEIQFAKQIGYHTPQAGAKEALNAMKNRPDRRHVLENTKIPVLIAAGRSDQIVPMEQSFAVKNPRIKEAVLEGAGHMGMLEKPDEMGNIILQFIEEHVKVNADE